MPERMIMASRFKAECLAILDQVDQMKISVTVTKHGRPVARLVPLESPGDQPAPAVRLIAEDDADYYATGEVWSAESERS